MTSCERLRSHLDKQRSDAQKEFGDWERQIEERELAEKRRVAPGWLDSEQRVLQPETTYQVHQEQSVRAHDVIHGDSREHSAGPSQNLEGEELDRAFGALKTQ